MSIRYSKIELEGLAERAKKDPEALTSLINYFQQEVIGYFRSKRIEPEDAADVFQKTSIQIWKNLPNLRPGTISGWVHTVANHLMGKELSRRRADPEFLFEPLSQQSGDYDDKRRREEDNIELADPTVDLERQVLPGILLGQIRKRAMLTEREGAILDGILESEPYEDIASRLGTNVGSVYSIFYRTEKKLIKAVGTFEY